MRSLGSIGVLAALIWCAPTPSLADSDSTANDYVVPLIAERKASSVELVWRCADKFSTTFFKKMYESDRDSRIFSPLSLFLPLSMLSYGAQGAARELFFSAIGLPKNETQHAKEGYRRLLDRLSRFKVYLRTKIYYSSTESPPPVFRRLAMKVFKSEVELVTADVEPGRINDWMRWQTANTGKNNIEEPFEVTARPSAFLATVLYLDGSWESRFDPSLTSMRPFFLESATLILHPTMYKFAPMSYGRIGPIDADFVELPFKSTAAGDAMSMFVVRPRSGSFDLNPIIDHIQKNRFEVFREVSTKRVNLWLPKFTYELVEDFHPKLRRMFAERENPLTGAWRNGTIHPPVPMSVKRALLKYLIEVNEDGDAALPPPIGPCERDELVNFDANRPFVAVIVAKGKFLLDVATLKIDASTIAPFLSI